MANKNQNLISRAPVVVVLGHVDHGKSSLLEAIKDFKITEKESGGITQHIGAYEIEEKGRKITFIDTPGHEAFSAMRSRGAKVADIALLVVAGDDGVQNQTKEAISHIKTAQIPMIVVINKMDKQESDAEKVKRDLVKEEVIVEKMGGTIPSIEISAKTKKGIPELLEMILLVAEMEDLKIDLSKNPEGLIIESYLDSLRGPTATIILQEGILIKGDIVGTCSSFGKIKMMENFQGKEIAEIFPGMPAVLIGFEKAPRVGENFKVFASAEEAQKNLKIKENIRQKTIQEEPGKKVLNLVLKADVLGSLEAIEEVLSCLPQEKSVLRIMRSDVGEINESDIKLAKSSKAVIIGFRVKINPLAKSLADREKISIRSFEIIYELAQSVRQALEKIIEPEIVRVDLGKVKILVVFLNEKNRQILGGKVVEGKIKKGISVEVLRQEEKIGKGKIIGLQRDKKDIDEVAKGSECGMLYEGDAKAEQGDIFVAYIEERRKIEL